MCISLRALLASLLFISCAGPQNISQTNTTPPPPAANFLAAIPTPVAVEAETAPRSAYTEISEKVCKSRKPDPDSGAIYEAECPGLAGYTLILSASDHSQVLSVLDPQKKETLLPFRRVLNTVADFVVGNKVEWRLEGNGRSAKPKAIIVRLTKFPHPEDRNKSESYLAVARLSGEPCVTDLVPPSAGQNVTARRFADSTGRECMKFVDP